MWLLAEEGSKEGAYAVKDEEGEKVLFMFEKKDDAERYRFQLEMDEETVLMDIVEVDDELLGVISRILSKNYSSIKIINHKYFVKKDAYDDFASTIVVSDANDLKYSDAYAGSGESSVISLVVKLHSLKEKQIQDL